MTLRSIALEDRFNATGVPVLLTGTQALVRLLLLQSQRDREQGLNTAGYVSGYRGSPLGGLDMQLARVSHLLDRAQVRFQPGVNEDLAATAIWGTQQTHLLPGARYDGVYSLWYGKGPGVDRSGDPFKHGNRMGTAPLGGVLLAFGDDHAGKSSTVAHQSEQALAASSVPVLYPATVQEYLDFGLLGWALSRFSGLWVGLKCVNETVETTATAVIAPDQPAINLPVDVEMPPGGLNARLQFDPLGDDIRLMRYKLPAARAFVHANAIDRVVCRGPDARLGIMAAGKSYLDVEQAFTALGLDTKRAAALGLALYKPGLIWPLEPRRLEQFAAGLDELLVVEEKAPFMEEQAARILYNLPAARRPRLTGKTDERGGPLLPSDVQLDGTLLARVIGERLVRRGLADASLIANLAVLERRLKAAEARATGQIARTPYFCSGCPHNTSTRVPEGSLALAGIGCHTMALYMDRSTLPPTQMGGEGMTWTGMAPFTNTQHVFQNLGDGTYMHSGLLAIRAAVNASVNITYKILVNDAVAMTGGQLVEGQFTVVEIARQLAAERVRRIAIVTDQPGSYSSAHDLAAGVTVHEREELSQLQQTFRELDGVTAIIYEQTCAAEKRRRRKRGAYPDPDRRVFINPQVCEGCGDCSVQSNCVSIEPLETEFGRKRRIDQSSCNKDYSCLKGFCPSFVTVTGATLRKADSSHWPEGLLQDLPPPPRAALDLSYGILVAGIGGTGIVTVGAVLAMAAHLEGLAASVFDMTGMAQKGGAVLSHLKIAGTPAAISSPKIGFLEADLLLGCDLVVATGEDAIHSIHEDRTVAVVNSHLVPTAAFQLNPDIDFAADGLIGLLREAVGEQRVHLFDADETARRLLGDALGANMLLVGHALQRGHLPLSLEAIDRAIELNGVAVPLNKRALALGRLAAHSPVNLQALLDAGPSAPAEPPARNLDQLVARRMKFLVEYQDAGYAERYRDLVERVARAERIAVPDSTELAATVARYYFKLLAYKDEYEVARLHTGKEFRRALQEQFAGDYRIDVHLAPPLLSRRDPATGRPQKRTFGPWILPVLRVLAQCRWLRGTAFDPFGYTSERRMERQLIVEYEATIGQLSSQLSALTLSVALEIAALPEQIRGFGPVKQRHVEQVSTRRSHLLERFNAAASMART